MAGSDRNITIVAFGDSVTQATPHVVAEQSFAARLQEALNRKLRPRGARVAVVNAGVGGENSAEGLARIEADVLDRDPTLVLIEFGLNDVRYEPEKAISPQDFGTNLGEMVRRIRDADAHSVLMTPNPIINVHHPYSQATDFYDRWGGCDQRLADYADVVREAADAEAVPLCDIRRAFIDRAMAAQFLGATDDYTDLATLTDYISPTDGVHPTARGHELIALELYILLLRRPDLLTRPSVCS
ncbi:MAG: SGNH/GDSL hydrolase family protein [Armatimonadota bacterium]